MNRIRRLLVFGDLDETFQVRPLREIPERVRGMEEGIPAWLLLPREGEFPPSPDLPESWQIHRVGCLGEAVRFVESLESSPEEVRALLSAGGEGSPDERLIPLRAYAFLVRPDLRDLRWLARRMSITPPAGERPEVRLYDPGVEEDLFRTDSVVWLLVRGQARCGKSRWLVHLEKVLQKKEVPVLRIEADRYAWGDGDWAEEIARALAATKKWKDGPAVSLLTRWLQESYGLGSGVLILDGVEGARPWNRFLAVVQDLALRWRGSVVFAGRPEGIRWLVEDLEDSIVDGKPLFGSRNAGALPREIEFLWLEMPEEDRENNREVLEWVEGEMGEEARTFLDWLSRMGFAPGDRRFSVGVLRLLARFYREGIRGWREVRVRMVKEGIREGLREVVGEVDENQAEEIFRALARALTVILGIRLGSRLVDTSITAMAVTHSPRLDLPAFIVWDRVAESLLERYTEKTSARTGFEKEDLREVLIRGLHRAGVWSPTDRYGFLELKIEREDVLVGFLEAFGVQALREEVGQDEAPASPEKGTAESGKEIRGSFRERLLHLRDVLGEQPHAAVSFFQTHLPLIRSDLAGSHPITIHETFWLLKRAFLQDASLAWAFHADEIFYTRGERKQPFLSGQCMILSFRILDKLQKEGRIRRVPSRKGKKNPPVEVVWVHAGDTGKVWTTEVEVGCLMERGDPVNVRVRARKHGESRDVIAVVGQENRESEGLLRSVWERFREEGDTGGLWLEVDPGGETLQGSLRFGAALALALVARKGAREGT